MLRGVKHKRYMAGFKQHVIETMQKECLSYRGTARFAAFKTEKFLLACQRNSLLYISIAGCFCLHEICYFYVLGIVWGLLIFCRGQNIADQFRSGRICRPNCMGIYFSHRRSQGKLLERLKKPATVRHMK